jgi:CBS domain-containing protein
MKSLRDLELKGKRVLMRVDFNVPTNIVKIMQDKKINRVPVLRHGKLIGIITRNDILKAMVRNNG